MKKTKISVIAISAIIILVLGTLLAGCSVGGNTLDNVKKNGKIVIGVDDTFPPMEFRDESNKLIGFDVDMMTEVGKRMNLKIEFQPTDWSGIFVALTSKKFDMITSSISITDERKKTMDFSTPYIKSAQVVVTKKDSKVDKLTDLSGKTVGVQVGTTGDEAAQKIKGIKEIKKYDKATDCFADLKAGRIEAVVIDKPVGRYYLQKNPSDFRVASEETEPETYGIAFRKGDTAFKDAVQKAVDEMVKDGTMATISKKWFGEDITK